jgi:hypothetical protein
MGDGPNISDRQSRVFQNLRNRGPKLAGLYQTALRSLDAEAEPGCEAARVAVICHCMRELMNGLPSILTDLSIPRPKPSSMSLLADLPSLLAKHSDLDLAAEQDVIPVPKTVAIHFHSLVKTRTQEDGRNRSNLSALITGGTDARHPAIKQWKDAYDFFLRWTHLDRNHEGDRELPSDQEIQLEVRVVEDVIEVRTSAFFENLSSLEDLLSEINATSEQE